MLMSGRLVQLGPQVFGQPLGFLIFLPAYDNTIQSNENNPDVIEVQTSIFKFHKNMAFTI